MKLGKKEGLEIFILRGPFSLSKNLNNLPKIIFMKNAFLKVGMVFAI